MQIFFIYLFPFFAIKSSKRESIEMANIFIFHQTGYYCRFFTNFRLYYQILNKKNVINYIVKFTSDIVGRRYDDKKVNKLFIK